MSAHLRNAPRESDLAFRELLSAVLKECGKEREQVAAELGSIVGRRISVSMLNDYASRAKTAYRFPAAYIPALYVVTGDDRLQRFLLSHEQRGLLAAGKALREAIKEAATRGTAAPEGAAH